MPNFFSKNQRHVDSNSPRQSDSSYKVTAPPPSHHGWIRSMLNSAFRFVRIRFRVWSVIISPLSQVLFTNVQRQENKNGLEQPSQQVLCSQQPN